MTAALQSLFCERANYERCERTNCDKTQHKCCVANLVASPAGRSQYRSQNERCCGYTLQASRARNSISLAQYFPNAMFRYFLCDVLPTLTATQYGTGFSFSFEKSRFFVRQRPTPRHAYVRKKNGNLPCQLFQLCKYNIHYTSYQLYWSRHSSRRRLREYGAGLLTNLLNTRFL